MKHSAHGNASGKHHRRAARLRPNGVRRSVFAMVGLMLAALMLFGLRTALRHGLAEASWPHAPGSIQQFRVVPSTHYEGTPRIEPRMVWKAEYKVVYSAAGQPYTAWFDSGLRGDELTVTVEAKAEMKHPQPQCRVKYNPARPVESIAACR